MIKGGYKIIDFTKPLTTENAVVIDGIYNSVEESAKAYMLSGISIGGSEYPDVFAQRVISSGDFVFTVYGYTITINDDDEITVAADELIPATTTTLGAVYQAAAVAKAEGEAPTKAEFDALITALTTAGIMAEAAEDPEE